MRIISRRPSLALRKRRSWVTFALSAKWAGAAWAPYTRWSKSPSGGTWHSRSCPSRPSLDPRHLQRFQNKAQGGRFAATSAHCQRTFGGVRARRSLLRHGVHRRQDTGPVDCRPVRCTRAARLGRISRSIRLVRRDRRARRRRSRESRWRSLASDSGNHPNNLRAGSDGVDRPHLGILPHSRETRHPGSRGVGPRPPDGHHSS